MLVANRVCTTDRSSANDRSITWSDAAAAGVSWVPRTTVVGVRPARSRSTSTTSVVVPERVSATTRS